MMVCGWIFLSTSFSASRSSSAASTATEVVPSPTSSSCTLEMLTRTFAAALSRAMDLRIVAPSFVTMISPVDLRPRRQRRRYCAARTLTRNRGGIRRLKYLVHALGTERALYEIPNRYRTDKGGEPG